MGLGKVLDTKLTQRLSWRKRWHAKCFSSSWLTVLSSQLRFHFPDMTVAHRARQCRPMSMMIMMMKMMMMLLDDDAYFHCLSVEHFKHFTGLLWL